MASKDERALCEEKLSNYPEMGESGIGIISRPAFIRTLVQMPKSLRSPRHVRLQALLAELRRSQNLTQTELAKLGKPQSFVAKTEGGERRLDVIEFIDLAAALKRDAVSLLNELISDPDS